MDTNKVKISNTSIKTINKSTHLHCQDKYLNRIPKIAASKHLCVIYLYNNNIRKIENLNLFPNLRSLYLQNNKIDRVENLSNLYHLKQLYLGHNRIALLEGLENLDNLEELYMEKQMLEDNMNLCIDPRTIIHLGNTLKILNISHNRLSSFSYLAPLKKLIEINAAFNNLDDLKEVCETISGWIYLQEANFTGNHFVKKHRYREDIIASSHCLEKLDNKVVTYTNRVFMKRFEEEKLLKHSKPAINLAEIMPSLPNNYPTALQKAASASILKDPKSRLLEYDLSTFDEKDAVYLAWNTLPKAKPLVLKTKSKLTQKKNECPKMVINNFPQISEF